MSFSFSRTWTSATKDERDKWHHVQSALHRAYGDRNLAAPVPHTWQEWLSHRQASVEAQGRSVKRHVEASRRSNRQHKITPLLPPFGGKAFNDNCSAVMAQETIWCPESPARKDRWGARQWPGKKEMVYEGDERAYSENGNFRRFLPLVRDWKPFLLQDGNDDGTGNVQATTSSAAFEKVPRLCAFEFDRLWRPPTMEDMMTPTEEIFFEDGARLLIQEVLEALDDDDIL